jgi:hypothetical protein
MTSVGDRPVRERPLCGPLLAKHRAEDLLLDGVVAPDRRGHAVGGEHRDLKPPRELYQATIVVRMRVRDDDTQERLAERLYACAQSPPV